MFEKRYEFTYGDLNCDGKIRVSTILDCLQDISGLHSDACGVGTPKLKELSMVWLLEGWRVRFESPFDKDKDAITFTGIMKMTDLRSYRKYEMYQHGERKITASGVWYAVDTEKMRIKRIPEIFMDAFESIDEEDNGLEYVSLRGAKEKTLVGEKDVEKRDLDTNQHLNNVKSVEIALDFIPDGFKIEELSVKYRKEILKGEHIRIYESNTAEGTQLEILNESDDVCVIVDVKGK